MIKAMPDQVAPMMEVVLERVESDLSEWLGSQDGAFVKQLVPRVHIARRPAAPEPSGGAGASGKASHAAPARTALESALQSQLHAGHTTAQALVRWMVVMLTCSHQGLTVTELRSLLAPVESDTLPYDVWVRLSRGVRHYIRSVPDMSTGGKLLTIFHSEMKQAVQRRYLRTPGDETAVCVPLCMQYSVRRLRSPC